MPGVGVQSAEVTADGHLVLTMGNGTTTVASGPSLSGKDGANGLECDWARVEALEAEYEARKLKNEGLEAEIAALKAAVATLAGVNASATSLRSFSESSYTRTQEDSSDNVV